MKAVVGGYPMSQFPLNHFVDILLEIWPTADFSEDYVLLNDLDHLRDLKRADRKKWLKKGKRAALRQVIQQRVDEISEAAEMEEDASNVDGLLEAFSDDLKVFKVLDEREKKVWLAKARLAVGRRFDQGSVVYFVGCGQFVKIGHTTTFSSRLSSLKTSSPQHLKVYLVLPGERDDEQAFHKRFSDLRVEGEWFRCEGELSNFINHYQIDSLTQYMG